MPGHRSPPWRQPGWTSHATAWIDSALADAGRRRTGPVEQPHLRPWSTVLSAPTDAGVVYLKTTAPDTANDAGITALLADVAPAMVVRPLATDVARRQILLPHGGSPMREMAPGNAELSHWKRLLPRYAELQLHLTGETDGLLAAGALDRRLDGLVAQYLELVDDPAQHAGANPHGLGSDELARLRELGRRFSAACTELVAMSMGESIQHDDLHSANVLLDDGAYRIIDWGDASLTHPFGTLLVTLRSAAMHAGLDEDARVLRELRDAYLEPWSGLASRAELLRAVELATWVGLVVRGLIWRAALRSADAVELAEWQDAVPEALRMLLERVPPPAP